MALDIFLCFARGDTEFALHLQRDFERQGYRIIGQTPETVSSMKEIDKRRLLIFQADAVVVVLSSHLLTDKDARGDYNEALNNEALNGPSKKVFTLTYTNDVHLPMEATLSRPINFLDSYETGMQEIIQQLTPKSHEQEQKIVEIADDRRNQRSQEWRNKDILYIHEHWPPILIIGLHAVEFAWRTFWILDIFILLASYIGNLPGRVLGLPESSEDSVGYTFVVLFLALIPILIYAWRVPYQNSSEESVARRKRLYNMLMGSIVGCFLGAFADFLANIVVTKFGGPSIFIFHGANWSTTDLIPGVGVGIFIGILIGRRFANSSIDFHYRNEIKDKDELMIPKIRAESITGGSRPIDSKLNKHPHFSIDCYISYEYADVAFAQDIQVYLQDRGYSAWLDERPLDDRVVARLRAYDMLLNASIVVSIFSQKSISSGRILSEYQLSSGLDKPVIPLIAETIELPLGMNMLQWIDFRQDFVEAMQKLAATIQSYSLESMGNDERKLLRQFRNLGNYEAYYSNSIFTRIGLRTGELLLRLILNGIFFVLNIALLGVLSTAINFDSLLVDFAAFFVFLFLLGVFFWSFFIPYNNFTNKAVARRRQMYDPVGYAIVVAFTFLIILGGLGGLYTLLTNIPVSDSLSVPAFVLLCIGSDLAFITRWIRTRSIIKRIRSIYGM